MSASPQLVRDVVELARTEYLEWRESSREALRNRLEMLRSQAHNVRARAHLRCQIYKEVLTKEARKRIAIYERVSEEHDCPEMLQKPFFDELRSEITRHAKVSVERLRDQSRQDVHTSGDSPFPTSGPTDPPGYSDQSYERFLNSVVAVIDR